MIITLIVILGLLLCLAGLAGCFLPFLPGPPLSFLALIIISFAKHWQPFSSTFLIIMGILTVLVTVLDYVAPAVGARKYGASKFGVWASILGILVGIFFFPPWGIFIGAFVGALAGEFIAGRRANEILRAGWGAFVGNMVNIGLKFALSVVLLFF